MEYFEDFDNDEIVENFNYMRQNEEDFIEYTEGTTQLKHKSKNQFVFESFATRLKNLKLRLNQNIDKDYNLITLNNEKEQEFQLKQKQRNVQNLSNLKKEELTIEGEDEINLLSSNFKNVLERERSINSRNPEFLTLYNKLNQICFSYLYLVNNYKKVFDIIKEEIEKRYNDKYINGLYICFELLIALIKDIREECFDYFVENNLEQIVKLIKVDSNELNDDKKFHLIDHVFTFFVNIFKFFEKSIQKNFKKLFVIYSELLFNNNKYIRLFACQSLCYIIKNLSKEEINDTFTFLFDIMMKPTKLFDAENKMDIDENNEEKKKENISSKNIIYNILRDNDKYDSSVKIVISDSISELLSEILINIKTLSIKADLILYKFRDISEKKKNNINIDIIFIQTFIKLIKKVNNKFTLDVLTLFHFFIINFFFSSSAKENEKENNIDLPNYQKLKSQKLHDQLVKIKNIFSSKKDDINISYIILSFLILSKELLLKNFKDNTSTFSDYIHDIITIFKDYIFPEINDEKDKKYEINKLQKAYIIEISCLLLKFHSNLHLEYPLSEMLITNNKLLNYFLQILLQLNSFPFFQSFSLYSFRSPYSQVDNDEYNIIAYNKDSIEEIFNNIINNENIQYTTLLDIIDTDEKIFGEDLGLIIFEEKQKNILINYIFSNSKNDLKTQISNLNEKNYYEIKKLIFICKMINNEKTTKYIQENIVQEIYNILVKDSGNEKLEDENEKLNDIFVNDFYYNSKHYINKKHCLLDMLLYSYKSCNEDSIELIKQLLIKYKNKFNNFGIYYSLLNSIIFNDKYNSEEKKNNISLEDLNLTYNLMNLLGNKNNYKYYFAILYKKYLIRKYSKDFKESEINIINEIFSSVETLLQGNINLTYDKKYSITFEIIVSKLELIMSKEGITKHKLELLSFILWFLLGCYWISLTKSVWPLLNKMLNQIFTLLVESINIMKYPDYKKDIISFIMKPINEIVKYIQKYPSENDYINKNNDIIKNGYIIVEKNKNDLNDKNINILIDEYKTISTFFTGMPTGLIDSYNNLLNSDEFFRDNFVDNIFVDTCSKFDTEGLLIIKQILNMDKNKGCDLNTDYNVLFNYIYEKENKTSFNSTIFKLKETLFGIMSKITNLSTYKNYENIKNILFNQIILSRSTLIQKYSIDILSIFDSHIKSYNKLLKEIVDSTSVLIKVNNLEKIMNDNNQLINEEDRTYLIPVMTRLYYSKYFNIKSTEFSATTRKLKIRNKINLINYFVQLKTNEFDEYIKIIFESINKELFNDENFGETIDYKNKKYNYALLNLRTLKKILEIIKLNLKQITKLFNENSIIENISSLIINCFIFMKQLGQKIKHNKKEIFDNCVNYIEKFVTNKIHNYFIKEEFDKYFDFMTKNIKEIKKESLHIFIMIFNQFYTNENMINTLAQRLCNEYKDNLLNKTTVKTNSIFKFFLSLSRHAKLHFIYIINDNQILKALFNSLQSADIERSFIFNIVDFFENIVSPYSIEALNEDEDKAEEENVNKDEKKISKYVEIMDIDDENMDEDSINNIKDDIPVTHKELINNFNKIIVHNFNDINLSLTSLIFNEKISPTIKDNLTLKIIEILLNIWSLYTNTNTTKAPKNYTEIPSVEELFNFILTIIQNDKKIYSNKEIFDNVLKLIHILILIKIDKINGDQIRQEEIEQIYNVLIHLIYKIENFNSRLLLAIVLREFYFLDNSKDKKLTNVLDYLIKLNTNTSGKRELGKELDNDTIIEIINNQLDNKFIESNINYLEVIIYQLLVLSSNANVDDFALNSSALDKLKEIFKYISNKNMHTQFKKVFDTFFELLNNNFVIYSKILYEIFYVVNSVKQNEITGKDLYELTPAPTLLEEEKNIQDEDEAEGEGDNINIINKKKNNEESNFFTDIMNFNIDKRLGALKMLENNLSLNNKKNKLSQYSIINFIIPVIENFLNYKYYIEMPSTDKKSKKNFIIKHKNDAIKEIISVTQRILPLIIEYPIKEDIAKRLLLFLFANLKKISKNNNSNNYNDFEYTIDIFKMTNESLTIILNSIIKVYFNTIEYDNKLVKISKEQVEELNKQILENNLENKDVKNKPKEDISSLNKKNTYMLISTMYNNLFNKLNEEILPEISKFQEQEEKENIDTNKDDDNNDKNNNKKVILSSLGLYQILTEEIYPTLKSLVYIDEKREQKNNYYIRNYIIVPYFHLVKLLPPIKVKSELNQLIIELINNLSSQDTGVRGKSRDGMKYFISNLNEVFVIKFFEAMKTSLNSGYQRHIFAYTVNFLLQFITNYKICEISLNLIMPILFDELFGDISAEKEIGNLVNKYKEAKENKGLNSMELIGKNISIKFLITDLVTPMKNYLMIRKNSSEMTQKVNEVIISLVKGIKLNSLIKKENEEIINDLLDYGYILIHLGVEKNQQNLKEIKKLKNIEIKGNDIYTVDFKNMENNPYVIEVANKFIEEKNEIIYSNLFAVLGLEFYITLLKNKIFNFSQIEKESELYEKLNNILETIFSCMKMTNSTVVVSKSIKIIISMITENEKFFVIKKNLNKITKNLFKLILSINSGDIPLAQSVLSAISAILTKFTFINVTDSQIKTLLSFLKLNIFNPEIKPYVFNCFYALIKKKILHPDIYDMINYMREAYLKSFDDNTITVCKKIFFDFINTYPLEAKGRLNHLNFYINNCESNTRKCELNSIDMLINFANRQNFEGIKENLDFLIMKMFTLYANSEDSELKIKIEELILCLYNNYNDNNNNCFKVYYDKALSIIEQDLSDDNDNENNSNIKVFGIIILSLLLNLNINFIDPNKLIKTLNKSIKEEINNMNTYIQNKMNKYDYLLIKHDDNKIQLKDDKNADEEDKSNSDRWNILYQILVCIERLFNNYINKSNSPYKIQKNNQAQYKTLFDNIILALAHPHSFVKTISLRLISNIILKSDFYDISENQLEKILSQINFILLSNPSKLFFEEKTFNYCKSIITNLIIKNNFKSSDIILNFMINLTNEVKKWISNKSNGLTILSRVVDLFDNVIEKVFYEEGNDDCYYLKPIIELAHRVNNNQLAEEIIKQKCGTIMEKINNKMNSRNLKKVYKELNK